MNQYRVLYYIKCAAVCLLLRTWCEVFIFGYIWREHPDTAAVATVAQRAGGWSVGRVSWTDKQDTFIRVPPQFSLYLSGPFLQSSVVPAVLL